ncbi:hypothetical protein IFM46972_04551 [Aspergillus udagawae]|uniref:RNA ligase/cyclic nucleotide phosphodiesterase n=1 Tax=Aspergillus udagawae TaxID=91492 RepID=A0A8H3NKI4_9EURO|nr:uncharacterized protein Aud_000082 [Aspergillus udagawae]GFF35437.1 hypothetical protein IFM46972_04551 [Aspergillus udagawae]GIC84268.1 hypothetical protein Aud_000082 [Aspergillus udagawae]
MSTFPISQDNPFQTLITETNNDAAQLQSHYETHRVNRNAQQAAKILAPDFAGWNLDEILMRLDGPAKEEGFIDPRNCLVIWARPSSPIRDLIKFVQSELRSVAPTLWFMPSENLHTTVLEVAHSLTEEQIESLVNTLQSSQGVTTSDIADYAFAHRTRLVKPMVGFDSAAMALTFVPAAGDASDVQCSTEDETYSYHHLRRDIFDMVRAAGIPVASRYIVPSAHLTIARFVTQDGFVKPGDAVAEGQVDPLKVKELIDKIDEINQKLQDEYWPSENGTIKAGGEWLVGQEKGLIIRRGRLWYGGGDDVQLGKGY